MRTPAVVEGTPRAGPARDLAAAGALAVLLLVAMAVAIALRHAGTRWRCSGPSGC